MVLQHGGSILGSVILFGTFRRISQLWDDAHTLNLVNCLLYLSPTISQFFDFIHRMVFDFIFYCVTLRTLYIPESYNLIVTLIYIKFVTSLVINGRIRLRVYNLIVTLTPSYIKFVTSLVINARIYPRVYNLIVTPSYIKFVISRVEYT